MTKWFCERCGKEMNYASNSAGLCVHHEDGKSWSINLSVTLLGSHSATTDVCEQCVKELTKIASRP